MYSRQNRNPRAEVSVDLPRDYSGSAFYPFPMHRDAPLSNPGKNVREEEKIEEHCEKDQEREEKEKCCQESAAECTASEACCPAETLPRRPSGLLPGLSGLLGGNIGLEELLLLGVIFLIFTDNDLRDSELLICLLLILFI